MFQANIISITILIAELLQTNSVIKQGGAMKKLSITLVAIMLIIAIVGLTGCQTKTEEVAKSEFMENESSETHSEATTSEPIEKVELTLAIWDPLIQEVCEEINSKFSEINPNVTIKIDLLPGDQYENVLKTRILGGESPDVFMYFGSSINKMAVNEYWGDLSDEAFVSRLIPGFKDVASYKGKVYAYPINSNGEGVFYNKDIFTKAGIDAPPKTLKEFEAACEKILGLGITPIAVGGKDVWPLQHMMTNFVASFNTHVNPEFEMDRLNGKTTFASSNFPLIFDTLGLFASNNYFIKGSLGITNDQAIQSVATGESAMMINGTWIVAQLLEANPEINLGYFPVPNADGGYAVTAFCDKAIGYSPTSEYPEIAKSLVAFYAEAEMTQLYLDNTKTLPCVTDVQPSSLPEVITEYMNIAKTSQLVGFFANYMPSSTYDESTKAIQGILAGDTNSTQAVIDNMDRTFDLDKDTVIVD